MRRMGLFLALMGSLLLLATLTVSCVPENPEEKPPASEEQTGPWQEYENPLVKMILENDWVVDKDNEDNPPEDAQEVELTGVVVYAYKYYAFIVGSYEGKENVGIRLYKPSSGADFDSFLDYFKVGDVVEAKGKIYAVDYGDAKDFNMFIDCKDDFQVLTDSDVKLPDPLEIPENVTLDEDHYGALVEATLTYDGKDDYDNFVFKNGDQTILVFKYSDMPADMEKGKEYYLLGVVGQSYGYKLFIQKLPEEEEVAGNLKRITIDEVVDGDTFKSGDITYRIDGIDTPEIENSSDKPIGEYGEEAKEFLESFKNFETYIYELGEDPYGRKLVILYGYDETKDATYMYEASVTEMGYARPLLYDDTPDDVKEAITEAYRRAFEARKGIFSKWDSAPQLDSENVDQTWAGTIVWLVFTPNATGEDDGYDNYYIAYRVGDATKLMVSIRPENFINWLGISVNDDDDIDESDLENVVNLLCGVPIKVYGELWWDKDGFGKIYSRAMFEFKANSEEIATKTIGDVITELKGDEYTVRDTNIPPSDAKIYRIKGRVTYMYSSYAYVVDENNDGIKLYLAQGDLRDKIETGDTIEVIGRPYVRDFGSAKEYRLYVGAFGPDLEAISVLENETIELPAPYELPAGSPLTEDLFGKYIKVTEATYIGTDDYGNYKFMNGDEEIWVSKYSDMPDSLEEGKAYDLLGVVGQHYGYKLFIWDESMVTEAQ